jgi:hypothetical protein
LTLPLLFLSFLLLPLVDHLQGLGLKEPPSSANVPSHYFLPSDTSYHINGTGASTQLVEGTCLKHPLVTLHIASNHLLSADRSQGMELALAVLHGIQW